MLIKSRLIDAADDYARARRSKLLHSFGMCAHSQLRKAGANKKLAGSSGRTILPAHDASCDFSNGYKATTIISLTIESGREYVAAARDFDPLPTISFPNTRILKHEYAAITSCRRRQQMNKHGTYGTSSEAIYRQHWSQVEIAGGAGSSFKKQSYHRPCIVVDNIKRTHILVFTSSFSKESRHTR
jgi:hypothetical protein